MAILTAGPAGIDFNHLVISDLLLGDVVTANSTGFTLKDGAWLEEFTGQFVYSNGLPSGGTVTSWRESLSGQTTFEVSGFSVPTTTFVSWAQSGDNEAARSTILAGNDQITGSAQADVLWGYGGNDTMAGGAGTDTISAGAGNDSITDASGSNYLRGDDGADTITGGVNFDDINGNKGDDVAHGGLGQDWVVGGQDNDKLYGDEDFDVVYGNLGADTCDGGAGADWVRGGQGNDSVSGGTGDDWLWGDRGDDTISGGAGADIFHSFVGAGLDRITDFNAGEGDRLQLDPGTTYAVAQVGADTVVTLGGVAADQVVLVGVSQASLPAGWIFVG